ncbi:S-adenosyl-L-methionine-dependent methyltransferase [Viridothelium virens]|uniref:S-adenosyl-L-methionine-dependent methyltransferase n=1 Tax=Viridothelium virens TaxID=1048519 RepID=A0A6A6HG46_VIRVR|nr:S-adenosyl-L-methionine-dependent methyltransferase [Viridothelium virens]
MMEQTLEQLRQFAVDADTASKRNLSLALREFSYALESPEDTTARITSYILEAAVVRTGIDVKLFKCLANSETPLRVEDLASESGMEADFAGRYLRCLASFGYIDEPSSNMFVANNVTKAIDDPGRQAEIIHYFDTVGPAICAMPEFHRIHGYTNPPSATNCPFQLAYQTSKSAFEFMPELSQYRLDAFHTYMSTRTANAKSWLSVYPFAQEIDESGPSDVVFVDVGGGAGHQCVELRKAFPELQGRVIVQDLEYPINKRLQHPGVEGMVHDAFKKQPVKGARFYYLRAVLHDWSDEACVSMLSNLKPAMDLQSRILIDEQVLPDQSVDRIAAGMDLTMMACFGSKERTESQWKNMLDDVGLLIERQRRYEGRVGYETVMTVRKKELS